MFKDTYKQVKELLRRESYGCIDVAIALLDAEINYLGLCKNMSFLLRIVAIEVQKSLDIFLSRMFEMKREFYMSSPSDTVFNAFGNTLESRCLDNGPILLDEECSSIGVVANSSL